MTTSFPSDDEIAEELFQYPAASLADALDEMVTHYLCFQTEEGYSEENYAYRKSCYYQSYYPYTHKAPWWKHIYWRFQKVDHPLFPEQTSLEAAAEFFIWMGRQRLHTKLLNGEAKAFGYAMTRNPRDLPVPIPPDVWGEDMSAAGIDWKASTVDGNALVFSAVQVVFAEDYELADINAIPTDQKPLPSTPVKKQPCNLSVQSRLKIVLNLLKDQITTGDRTLYYPMILKKFFEQYPATPKNIRGLGDETLRKALEKLEIQRMKGQKP